MHYKSLKFSVKNALNFLLAKYQGWKSDSQVQMEPSEPTISEIKAEIEQFETLKKIWGIHQQMAEVTIFYGSNHTVIDALLEWSVEELLIQVSMGLNSLF